MKTTINCPQAKLYEVKFRLKYLDANRDILKKLEHEMNTLSTSEDDKLKSNQYLTEKDELVLKIMYVRQIVLGMEAGLKVLSQDECNIIKLYFFQPTHDITHIAYELKMDESTIHRKKKAALEKLCSFLDV